MNLEFLKKVGCRDKGLYRFAPVIGLFLLFPFLSPFPCSAQTPISFGETITATISAPGEIDTYTFDAVAGDKVWVEISSRTNLDPYIRLYDPDGINHRRGRFVLLAVKQCK